MLERRADELRALIRSTAESRQPVELDQVAVGRLSRMDALQRQAMAQATAKNYHVELGRIDAALKRAAAGEYGWCVLCGEEIAAARLSADPTVAACFACASQNAGRFGP